MRIRSTINAKTQSVDDVPVVLVTLDGKRKFLPRPETYKDMERLVRSHYEIDPHAALQFEVSTWDMCAGQNVEVTEAAYALLAPFLDSVSVVVGSGRAARVMPTPSATPPLQADDGTDDEQSVEGKPEPEASHGRGTESPPRQFADRAPKLESEDEEEVLLDEASVQDRDARQESQLQYAQEKEEAIRSAPKERAESSRANRGSDDTAESSQPAPASDDDQKFVVLVSAPGSAEREFSMRGRYKIRKVLEAVCKTFKLDYERAKLMLCVSMEDDDGEEAVHHFECANNETVARSGVKPDAHLVVRIVEEEQEEDEYYEDDD